MQYYSKVAGKHYRLCSAIEGRGSTRANDFLKWSSVFDPSGTRVRRTKEFTVHPTKIAVKTTFPHGTRMTGDYKGKESLQEYETLYEFGYCNTPRSLVCLYSLNVSDGFLHQKAYGDSELKRDRQIIEFPDDPRRPYWIGAFFSKARESEVLSSFSEEGLDAFLFFKGSNGNLVTLIKFVEPEWESLGLEPDSGSGWVHPTFILSNKFE